MKTALETWCAGILDNCLRVYWGKTNVKFEGNSDSDLKILSEWEQRWKRGERRVQSSSSWRKDTDCQVNYNIHAEDYDADVDCWYIDDERSLWYDTSLEN